MNLWNKHRNIYRDPLRWLYLPVPIKQYELSADAVCLLSPTKARPGSRGGASFCIKMSLCWSNAQPLCNSISRPTAANVMPEAAAAAAATLWPRLFSSDAGWRIIFNVTNKDKGFSAKLSHSYVFFMIECIHYCFLGMWFIPLCIASFRKPKDSRDLCRTKT